ncbi:MAG: hypothetical protein QFB87_00020 [Patescibacteria group bacterium]|nr:hypothetical protein [Patescibacteria group bacterium]
MSEQAPNNLEHGEALLPAGETEKLLEATTERSPAELQAEAAAQQATVEAARAVAETVERDDPLARLEANEAAAANQEPAAPPNSFLLKQSLKQELRSVQRKESRSARTLSKVVHQPAVQVASDVAAKTVSRPSGLLGGGLLALVGSSCYLYLAYHIGFVYQPTVFLLLLVLGFGLGVVAELVIRLVVRTKPTV